MSLLIDMKMSTIVIEIFIIIENFMHNYVEHEKKFYTLRVRRMSSWNILGLSRSWVCSSNHRRTNIKLLIFNLEVYSAKSEIQS